MNRNTNIKTFYRTCNGNSSNKVNNSLYFVEMNKTSNKICKNLNTHSESREIFKMKKEEIQRRTNKVVFFY